MRYHRSCKLLSHSTSTGGKLTVYTELDHTFLVGDKVYIIGGYYDNSSAIYNSTWSNINNFYTTDSLKPYNVLAVNYANNSIILDLDIVSEISPYANPGAGTNRIADPNDSINKAYNNHSDKDMYKGVYISQMFNANCRVLKSTINNGVFGTDLVPNFIGKKHSNGGTISNKSDIDFNHGIGKNIRMDYGKVSSKTPNTVSTLKFKVNNFISGLNAVSTTSAISVGNNNDGQGYSYFDKAAFGYNPSVANWSCELYRSKVSNGKYNAISFYRSLINGAEIGTQNIPELISHSLTDSKVYNNSTVYNSFIASGFRLEDSKLYLGTEINLNSLDIQYLGAGIIRFKGFSNSWIKDCFIDTTTYSDCRIIGFYDQTTDRPIEQLDKSLINILNLSYDYNNDDIINNNVFDLYFYDLDGNDVDFIANYTDGFGTVQNINNLDNLIFYLNGYNNINNLICDGIYSINRDSNLRGIFADVNFVNTNLAYSNIFTNSILTNTNHIENSDIISSTKRTSYLNNIYQLKSEGSQINTFDYCVVENLNDDNVLSGNFNNSYIYSGAFSSSTFTNSELIPNIATTRFFIYNCNILGTSKVDSSVEWEYVNFNPTVLSYYEVSPGVYEASDYGHFKGRLSSFTTGSNAQTLPLASNSNRWNLNTQKTVTFNGWPLATINDMNDAIVKVSTYDANYPTASIETEGKFSPLIYQAASGYDNGNGAGYFYPSNNNVTISHYNLGDFYYNAAILTYIPQNNRNYLMIADTQSNNTQLNTVANDILASNISGINDTDLDIPDSNPYSVDGNYVYTYSKYHVKEFAVKRTNSMLSLYEPGPDPGGFPVDIEFIYNADGLAFFNNIVLMEYDGTPLTHNTLTNDGLGYVFSFEQTALEIVSPQTLASIVTSNFIEIESITVEQWDAFPPGNTTIQNAYVYTKNNTGSSGVCGSITRTYTTYPDAYNSVIAYDSTIQNIEPIFLNITDTGYFKITLKLELTFNYQIDLSDCGRSEFREITFWCHHQP